MKFLKIMVYVGSRTCVFEIGLLWIITMLFKLLEFFDFEHK